MPDKRFYKREGQLSLKDIARIGGAELGEGADAAYMIEDVAPLDRAGPRDLSFFDNVKYREQFSVTKAGACFLHPSQVKHAPKGVNLLLSETPYKAYALTAQKFYPKPMAAANISDRASVHPSAKVGKGCAIEPGAVVLENAEIGEGCWIEANAVIGPGVILGAGCRIGTNASVSHAIIGSHVYLYPGVRVGTDGFGFAIDPAGHVKVPQLGRVIIEDHVEIGANTTIDRGAGPDTVIGQGTWIDNLVQIGHNARIGRGCVIVAHVGISGSAILEDYVVLGGQVGVAGHITVGKGARVGAQSGVMRNLEGGQEYLGSPAIPARETMKQVAALNRLIKKEKSS